MIKIQSISDIITNSSTEVFMIADESSITTIKELIDTFMGQGFADENFNVFIDYKSAIADNYRGGGLLDYINDVLLLYNNDEDEDIPKDLKKLPKDLNRATIYNYLGIDARYLDDKTVIKLTDEQIKILDDCCKYYIDYSHEHDDCPVETRVMVIPKDTTNEQHAAIANKLSGLANLYDIKACYC